MSREFKKIELFFVTSETAAEKKGEDALKLQKLKTLKHD